MRTVCTLLFAIISFQIFSQNTSTPCMDDKKSREFDFWIGEWDVYKNGTNIQVGESKIEMASGGCMILENWTSKGQPYTGKSMNYVNPSSGKWEQLWIGSNGMGVNNPQRFFNGEYTDNAMRFMFERLSQQNQKQMGKFTFFNQGPDEVRQFSEVSNDNGKTWTTMFDYIYKRRKS